MEVGLAVADSLKSSILPLASHEESYINKLTKED